MVTENQQVCVFLNAMYEKKQSAWDYVRYIKLMQEAEDVRSAYTTFEVARIARHEPDMRKVEKFLTHRCSTSILISKLRIPSQSTDKKFHKIFS